MTSFLVWLEDAKIHGIIKFRKVLGLGEMLPWIR